MEKDKSGNLKTLDNILRDDGIRRNGVDYADPKAGWAHKFLRKIEVGQKHVRRKDENGRDAFEMEDDLDENGEPTFEEVLDLNGKPMMVVDKD